MRGYLLNSPEKVHKLWGVHDSWIDTGGEEQSRKMTNDGVTWKKRIVLVITDDFQNMSQIKLVIKLKLANMYVFKF